MLGSSITLVTLFTVVSKICANFDSGVGYLDRILQHMVRRAVINRRFNRECVWGRVIAGARLVFNGEWGFVGQSDRECLCTPTSAEVEDWSTWINGRIAFNLAEWQVVCNRLIMVYIWIELVVFIFFSWTLFTNQIFRLGVVFVHSFFRFEEFYWLISLWRVVAMIWLRRRLLK